MTQEQRAVIRGGCAECPGRAKGYKWSLMGRSHRPRGEFNRRSRGGERSEFLSLSVPDSCAEQLDTGWFSCPV